MRYIRVVLLGFRDSAAVLVFEGFVHHDVLDGSHLWYLLFGDLLVGFQVPY